jgi:hypothetical protein
MVFQPKELPIQLASNPKQCVCILSTVPYKSVFILKKASQNEFSSGVFIVKVIIQVASVLKSVDTENNTLEHSFQRMPGNLPA